MLSTPTTPHEMAGTSAAAARTADLPPLRAVGSLEVPRLCLGASGLGNMGGAITDATALATVHSVIEDAVTSGHRGYIETSPAYGMGLSERRVGLAMGSHPRDEIFLQTKVGVSCCFVVGHQCLNCAWHAKLHDVASTNLFTHRALHDMICARPVPFHCLDFESPQ